MPGGDGYAAAQVSPDAAAISPPRQRHGRVQFRAAGDALAAPACSPDHARGGRVHCCADVPWCFTTRPRRHIPGHRVRPQTSCRQVTTETLDKITRYARKRRGIGRVAGPEIASHLTHYTVLHRKPRYARPPVVAPPMYALYLSKCFMRVCG